MERVDQVIQNEFEEARKCFERFWADSVVRERIGEAAVVLADCFRTGGHAYSCGNGGSMCDAMHFAEELSGRYRGDRPALGAMAFSDPGHLTCVGNDYGFEEVFARAVEAQGRRGDVLVVFSTSGSSRNVVRACEAAREIGMKIVALTGREGSEVGGLADVTMVCEGAGFADRVQEMHIQIVHILIGLTERLMFDESAD
ncbi:phosphoheptose isomerase [Armatimonadetes bacterium Uphvl-Ar1]|nr:phosphoheptose isomerase [Armatimonadetes bacterium Uphvl-Ar1]